MKLAIERLIPTVSSLCALANVNWKYSNGDTPLLAACHRQHSLVASILLNHGADPFLLGKEPTYLALRTSVIVLYAVYR